MFESLGGENWLDFDFDKSALARHHVDAAAAQTLVELMTTGGQVGEVQQGGRLLRVRLAPDIPDVSARGETDILRDITIRSVGTEPSDASATGFDGAAARISQPTPLALLGKPTYVRRAAALRVEKGELCAYVHVDLADGVDIQGYVVALEREVNGALKLGRGPPRSWRTCRMDQANTIC